MHLAHPQKEQYNPTMEKISIEIPVEILAAAQTSPEELKRSLALAWYRQGKISLTQAATLATLPPEEISALPETHFDLDEFLDWASHDLKTPLNAVIGFSKVVLKGIDGPVNETQATDLASVHANGQKMLTYMNHLVDAARLNRGDITLKSEEVEIATLVEEALARWNTQNPAKQAFFLSLVAPASPKILADPPRMRQLLNDLFNFAALHLENEGRLTLEMEASGPGWLVFQLRAIGLKSRAVPKVDTELAAFVARGLIGLHGGRVDLFVARRSRRRAGAFFSANALTSGDCQKKLGDFGLQHLLTLEQTALISHGLKDPLPARIPQNFSASGRPLRFFCLGRTGARPTANLFL